MLHAEGHSFAQARLRGCAAARRAWSRGRLRPRPPRPRPAGAPAAPTPPRPPALTCPQVRWCGALSTLLRDKKRLLRLVVDWRPLVALLRDTHLRGDLGYEGSAITMSHMAAVGGLVRSARRFFPPASGPTVWAALRPALQDLSGSDALLAAGFAALLLPCTHIGSDGDAVPWPALVAEVAALLRAVPDCRYWCGRRMGRGAAPSQLFPFLLKQSKGLTRPPGAQGRAVAVHSGPAGEARRALPGGLGGDAGGRGGRAGRRARRV